MKRWLVALLLLTTVCFASNDPWEPYDAQGKGKGKGPPHPVVPESSAYGAILVGGSLAILGARRWYLSNRNKSL
jgi:hypothetical protein